MEIKDVFSAQPKSVWEYLCENGQGLYIPAYQRQYSWDKSKIERLIEDACHGFKMLVEHKDSITFIGTIIAIHDTDLLTVAPIVRNDVPSKVMTIIDGQQRLTTLLLINTVLHEEIKGRLKEVENSDVEAETWLHEECMKVTSRLGKTFEEDKDYGDDGFKFYPRMIRAYDDSWSRKKDKALYLSPIGNYLHSYGNFSRRNTGKVFSYSTNHENEEDKVKYDFLKSGRNSIKKTLLTIAKNKNDGNREIEIPNFETILGSKIFQNILLNADIPEYVSEHLLLEQSSSYEELMRLVLFANFILDRVAITIVTAKNEDYAFDMFESLNTTGEPLTAFETFKPRVIYSEKLEKYKDSESYQYIDSIESYLESFSRPKDKQDSTSRLIIYFALAETGDKLSLRLSDQRKFLRDHYEKTNDEDPDHKEKVVRNLSHTAIFMNNIWPRKKSDIPNISFSDDDHLKLCIDVLRQMNHTITIALMVRYFSRIRQAYPEQRDNSISEFISAVKAVTAFSILWRSSRKGTDAIDSIYRELMSSGCHERNLPPLARSKNNSEFPLAENLKKSLVFILKERGGISGKSDWVRIASKLPAYSNHRESTRLILLAATHDSLDDPERPGLTISGKEGLLPLLNFSTWRGESSQTVEHIAPKEGADGWLREIYDDQETIDRLGNLTLLSSSHNSSASNSSWNKKRLMYKVFSARTQDELEPLLKQAKDNGIDFSESTTDILSKSQYLPLVSSISKVNTDWNIELIDDRSNRIASLAWDRLFAWLIE